MASSRITNSFSQLEQRGEGALIIYLMGGDPDPQRSFDYLIAAAEGGADILEIGVPFSDPVADGPTIQAAGTRALRANANTQVVLELAKALGENTNTPLVLMSYYNTILAYGEGRFAAEAARHGVDGLIVPDLPPEEAMTLRQAARDGQLSLIFLATPETDEDRLKPIAQASDGFLYLVSRHGTTGVRERLPAGLASLIGRVRGALPEGLPLAVGFGLAAPQHIREVLDAGADGAVVGSKAVEQVAQGARPEELAAWVGKLKEATVAR